MKKRFWWILAGIIAFLVITNPSINDFRVFSGNREVKREKNFLIFSIYSQTISYYSTEYRMRTFERKKYLGIIKNFIALP